MGITSTDIPASDRLVGFCEQGQVGPGQTIAQSIAGLRQEPVSSCITLTGPYRASVATLAVPQLGPTAAQSGSI